MEPNQMRTADSLLRALADQSGSHEIVSIAKLSAKEIDTARAENRLFVNWDNLGFVLRPSPQSPESFKYLGSKCREAGCQALVLDAELRQWRAGRRP